MDHEKIAKAAELCLGSCAQTDRPLIALAALIKAMQDDLNWTDEEISAVRSLATQELFKMIEDRNG
jgi:hypothetical protein